MAPRSPKGVRVNAVSPGPTRTEGAAAMGDALQQLAAQAPAGRPAAPAEIAEAIVFLATDRQFRPGCDPAGRWRQNRRIDFVARSISVGAASTDGDDVDPQRPIAVVCAPRALPRPAGHGRMIMRHALVRKPLAHRVDRRATPARRVLAHAGRAGGGKKGQLVKVQPTLCRQIPQAISARVRFTSIAF
jgi:hypothetical protein